MQYLLQLFQQNRRNIIQLLENSSLEEVNAIPTGFNNNLIWNAGHALLSQQFLMYHAAGLPLHIPAAEVMPKYASGTLPDGQATQEDLDQLLEWLKHTAEKAVTDYQAGSFQTYTEYTSEYFGVSMKNI
ncbi:MAG: DinB family protein, partial [Bacteroidota bacterium]